MKRCIVLILAVLLLCGCAAEASDDEKVLWTEEQLLEIFAQHARPGAEAFACVVMEESLCNVAGVVQYTLEEPDICRFDFIRNDRTVFRMGMEFQTDGEKTLQCAGTDSISFRIIDQEDGDASTLTVTYYEDSKTGEKGFRVSQSE